MFDRLKTLFAHTTVYGLGDVATSLVGLLLLPIFTRYLTPAEYGVIALLLTAEAVTKVLFRWGVDTAFLRLYYDCVDNGARQALASSIFFFLLGINGILVAVGLGAAPWIATRLLGDVAHTMVLRLVFLNTFVIGFFFIPFALLRIENRARRFATVTFSRTLATLCLRLLFVVVFGMGVLGVVLADTIITALYALILARWSAPLIRPMFSRRSLREALRFGLPKLPHGVAHLVTALSDRYFLGVLATASDVGVYSIGATFGLSLKYFLSAFQTAWSPFLYEMMDKPDARDTYRAVTTYVFLTLVLLAAGLSAIADELIRLMTTAQFHQASAVVPWVAIGAVLQGFFQLTSVGIAITKRTRYYPIATGLAACSSVGANLFLIPRFGIIGAAWSQVVAYGVLAAAGLTFSQRSYPIRYEWSRLARIVVAGLLSYTAATAVPMGQTGTVVAILGRGLAVVLIYPTILIGLGFFRATEMARIRQVIGVNRPSHPAPVDGSADMAGGKEELRLP